MKKPTEIICGFSKSAWKSLAVKSLRIGWPAGLRVAESALGKSEMKMVLTCGVFEDIFPAVSEINQVMHEIRSLDYEALCQRETHHGRGHTERFCQLEPQAVAAAEQRKPSIWARGKELGIWLPLRSLNCFWTWDEIHPNDAGKTRDIDTAVWNGMPAVMLDAHTKEGKALNQGVTLLSGHYHQHHAISEHVARDGWAWIRAQVHNGRTIPPEHYEVQEKMFT